MKILLNFKILLDFRERLTVIDNTTEFDDLLFKNIHDHRSKKVFYLTTENLEHYMKILEGQVLDRMIEDVNFGILKVLPFPRNHRLFESFNKKVEQIKPAGIINHFRKDENELLNKKRFENSNLENARPMNLQHLEAGFAVWLITISLSIAAFVAEWICKCIFNLKRFIGLKATQRKIQNQQKEVERNKKENEQKNGLQMETIELVDNETFDGDVRIESSKVEIEKHQNIEQKKIETVENAMVDDL
jgi:hypothetical protein